MVIPNLNGVMGTPILCAAIAAAAWLPVWRAPAGVSGCTRSALLMSSRELPAPPAPPTLATRDYDGGDDGGLVLSSMTPETLQAVVSLWQWQQYAQQSGAADVEGRAVLHSLARWRGYNTTHGWGGLLRGQAFGAYVGGQVHGLVVVAYPRDVSTVCRALVMKHAMYVENIAVAPAIPAFTALDLQSAITNTMIRRAACVPVVQRSPVSPVHRSCNAQSHSPAPTTTQARRAARDAAHLRPHRIRRPRHRFLHLMRRAPRGGAPL